MTLNTLIEKNEDVFSTKIAAGSLQTSSLGSKFPIKDAKSLPSPSDVINASQNETGLFVSESNQNQFDILYAKALHQAFDKSTRTKEELQEFLETNESNGRPLFMQMMMLKPSQWFRIHAHPTIEFVYCLHGSLHEYRMTSPDPFVNRNDLKGDEPQGPLICQETKFEKFSLNQGETLVNEIGSVHQSFIGDEEAAVLLVIWGGCHANTHPSRVLSKDSRLRPNVGWDI
ncbi:hypothetical protein CTEN210_00353 [Chaetoceros tenuissimus]|uniref:Uncharacterized protein n=1 Tax=Chaetoceros tenuissimus TaxID=426638 RepID=A0AAD3GYR2_9STRA|nr:hypothetical protein CTEN210_00353 [Chaetoceros tenuissimus]